MRKAIATGRIATEDDGTIDARKADAEWGARTDPAQQRGAHSRADAARTAAMTAAHAPAARPVPRAAFGAGALLHLLQTFDLTGFDPRNPPETAALSEQKIAGLKGVDAWWLDVLTEGDIRGTMGNLDAESSWLVNSITVSTSAIREWMSERRWQGDILSERQFGKERWLGEFEQGL